MKPPGFLVGTKIDLRCERRVLELWEVGHFERYLKQFVRDELPQCTLQQSTQEAIKKINNKTAPFARASQEAWMVHLKEPKATSAAPGHTVPLLQLRL